MRATGITIHVSFHKARELLPFGNVRSIRHAETYNVIVRIYIYRLASILQSNMIYEADPRDVFNAGRKLLERKSVTWRITVHTATVKNDRRLTKRLLLNRATGAIHHYLTGCPAPFRPVFYTVSLLSLSRSFLSGAIAYDSIISRLRFSGAIPQETTYSRQVARTMEFIRSISRRP